MDRLRGSVELGLPSPMHELIDDRLRAPGVRLFLKRDDLVSPLIPGNKWRKLKYNLEEAGRRGENTLLTFGGAYSNHIGATAAAGCVFGFTTIGIIRGEEHQPLNPTLEFAADCGMSLGYVSREEYRRKSAPETVERLRREHGDFYLIPEGGGNALGVRGCREIVDEIEIPFDVICCSCGTGATLAGIALDLRGHQRALGFSALKGDGFLDAEVAGFQRELTPEPLDNWSIEYGFHFGGFAKKKPELLSFITDFKDRHGIELEWVYEAKMMYGLLEFIGKGAFPPGTRVVAVIAGPPG